MCKPFPATKVVWKKILVPTILLIMLTSWNKPVRKLKYTTRLELHATTDKHNLNDWSFQIDLLTSGSGFTSMTNLSWVYSMLFADGDCGRTVHPSSMHLVDDKVYVIVFIWRVTRKKEMMKLYLLHFLHPIRLFSYFKAPKTWYKLFNGVNSLLVLQLCNAFLLMTLSSLLHRHSFRSSRNLSYPTLEKNASIGGWWHSWYNGFTLENWVLNFEVAYSLKTSGVVRHNLQNINY